MDMSLNERLLYKHGHVLKCSLKNLTCSNMKLGHIIIIADWLHCDAVVLLLYLSELP